MLIATYNANSIRTRLEAVMMWIKTHQPDILCIQETKVQDHEFPSAIFEQANLHVAFKGEKSYNGVAIVSRQAPDEVTFGFDDGGQPDDSRLAIARFGNLHIINTYVPQGREIEHPMYAYKLAWFKRLKQLFSDRFAPSDALVWVGDLNVAPDAIDIHNAERHANHVCFHESVRQAFADTCRWGFHDVFRHFHPEAGHYTYFDYRTPNAAKRGMGWRIDHVLATQPMLQCAQDSYIDLKPRLDTKPSDHTFLCAHFDKALQVS